MAGQSVLTTDPALWGAGRSHRRRALFNCRGDAGGGKGAELVASCAGAELSLCLCVPELVPLPWGCPRQRRVRVLGAQGRALP